jgi:GH24 family phage-related lysozyme (muramidase)
MQLSAPGTAFIAAHEGFVSKAYLCPSSVRTIGYGFTMGSKVFADYWRSKHGRALQMGDTITRAEADMLLQRMVDAEYGAAVNREIAPKKQHHFDGASSMTFNCGTGALKWKWAQALKSGNVSEAARLLRTTAITANGRKLVGLVRRRAEEATLIRDGRYTGVRDTVDDASKSTSKDAITEYQQMLKDLGYPVAVDGIDGLETRSAVKRFQTEHDLVSDGIVGPATRAALIRALDAKRGAQATGGAAAAGGAGGAVTVGDPASMDAIWHAALWGIAGLVIVGGIFLFIRYRGRITGQRVPT